MGIGKRVLLLGSMGVTVLVACVVALWVGSDPAEAAFPGTNGKIVFAEENYDSGDENGVRLINPSGTALSASLTDTYPVDEADPAFSNGATRIAYAGRTAGFSDSRMEIYKLNLLTRAVTKVTRNESFDGNPTWKPDNSRIAFEHERTLAGGGKDTDIFVKRSDGTGKSVNKTSTPNEDEFGPAWSPDGEEIVFYTYPSYDIVVLNLLTGQRRNLTNDGDATIDHSPSWSPDGTRIVFESLTYDENFDTDTETIYTMDASEGSDRRLLARAYRDITSGQGAYYAGATYSPDGEQIAYVRTATDYVYGDPQIWKMNASDGSDKRQVYDAYKSRPGEYPYTETVSLRSPDWGEQRPPR